MNILYSFFLEFLDVQQLLDKTLGYESQEVLILKVPRTQNSVYKRLHVVLYMLPLLHYQLTSVTAGDYL